MMWVGKENEVVVVPVQSGKDEPPVAMRAITATIVRANTDRGRRISVGYVHAEHHARLRTRLVVSRAGKPLLNAYRADTWLQRVRGLFAFPALDSGQALLLNPCSAVHTIGMKYSIDVAFLDKHGAILKFGTLKPWTMNACFRADRVLEMTSGTALALNLKVGQYLDVEAGACP